MASSKVRILTRDEQTKEKSNISAYVVWGFNYINQRRQFAYDGRYWFYQPDNRSAFMRVNPRDLPQNVVDTMARETGINEETLRRVE
jgi:hypothetical protein